MLLPHFFGWSPEQLRNFFASQSTLLPYYLTPDYPLLHLFATYGRTNFCFGRMTATTKRKTTFESLKREYKIKRELRQNTHTNTNTRLHIFSIQPKWMARRDARVSSFIMHACVSECICSASFTLIQIPFARFLLHTPCINGFSNRLFHLRYERVCESVFRFRSMLHFSNVWLYFIRICVVFLRQFEMKKQNR